MIESDKEFWRGYAAAIDDVERRLFIGPVHKDWIDKIREKFKLSKDENKENE